MVQEMGPMESAVDSEENETNGYSVVERENEKAAHQFVPYAVKKPGLCAYCKGVLLGKIYILFEFDQILALKKESQ